VGEGPEEPTAPIDATDNVRALQEQVVRQNADYENLSRAYERTKDAQTAASERVTALAAALATATRSLEAEQNKTREYAKAVAERSASADAHQLRGEELLRKCKDYEAELVEIRQSHDALKGVLATRDTSATAGTAAMAGDLADLRAQLDSAHRHVSALQETQAEQSAGTETLRSRMQDALRASERHEAEVKTLRIALVDRDVKLAALQQEQASAHLVQETRAKTGVQVQADLAAARARADALLLDLNSSRGTAAAADAQLKRAKFDLEAARAELAAVKEQSQSYFDLLRTHEWRRAAEQSASEGSGNGGAAAPSEETLRVLNHELQTRLATTKAQLEQRDAFIAQLRASRRDELLVDRSRAQAVPVVVEPTGMEIDLQPLPSMQATPKPAIVVERLKATFPPAAPRNPFPAGRAISWIAAVLVFAGIVWFFTEYGAGGKPVAAGLEAGNVPGSVIHDCPTCPAMTVLPAGRFKQGATAEESSGSFDKPLHWVEIAHPFAVSTNTVTLDEFQAFVTATARDMQGCDTYDGAWKHVTTANWRNPGFPQTGSHPVTCVSWNDAQAYASWMSSKAGHPYRLPSASEWEYAARAGVETAAPWSTAAADACANANVADQSAAQQYPGWSVFGCSDGWVNTAPVGKFKANAFGLNDMLGNVFQWTQDCWKADYAHAPVDGSARSDGDCAERELRGGSWFSSPSYVRSNYRNHFAADYRTATAGIRLVREME
jgi:sulfatase modifying factor 1